MKTLKTRLFGQACCHIIMVFIMTLIIEILIPGCSKSISEKTDPFHNLDAVLKEGMDQGEVIALLGNPGEIRGDESFTVFVYQVDSWPELGQKLDKTQFKYKRIINGVESAIFEYTIHFKHGKYEKYDTSGMEL